MNDVHITGKGKCIDGSKGTPGMNALLSPIFFIFMQFSGEIGQNNKLALGHPRSTTEMGLKMTVSLYRPSYQNVSDEYLICFEQDLFN